MSKGGATQREWDRNVRLFARFALGASTTIAARAAVVSVEVLHRSDIGCLGYEQITET